MGIEILAQDTTTETRPEERELPEGHTRCHWEQYNHGDPCSEVVAKTDKNKRHVYYFCERHKERYDIREDF